MQIREYRSTDFLRICDIGKVIDPSPPQLYYREKIGSGKTWVIEDDKQVIGFLISTIKYWKSKDNVALPYVNNLAIDPAHQRKGYATQLINHFEKYYKGFDHFGLYVRVDNPALFLYLKQDYKIVERLERFYGEDKDGFFMVKAIKNA